MRATLLLLTPLLTLSFAGCSTPRLVTRAKAQLARGDYAGAEKSLASQLAQHPDDHHLAGLAMRALFAGGKKNEAITLYRRRAGVRRLRELAIARLWAAMRDRDPKLRLAAVQSARRIDASPVAPEMVRRLMDPDPLVRTWAAVALSATPLGAELLGRQLKARDRAARAVAIEEIGRLAGKSALAQIEKFVTDPAPRIRQACATALAYGSAPAARKLLLALAADTDAEVRIAAYRSIAQLRLAEGLALLAKASTERKKGERRAALIAFTKLAKPTQGKALLRRIAVSDDLGLALVAGRQLAKWGDVQPVLDTIARALLDRRYALRVAAINTASGVRDPVAYELAKKALRDPEPAVRLAAISLAQSKDRDAHLARAAATTTFAQLCPKPEGPCLQVARLLAAVGDSRAKGELQRLARKAETWSARATALRHLAQLHAPDEALVAAFGDTDVRVALVAVETIWRRK